MKTVLKVLGAVVGLMVVLIVVGAIAVPLLFDPNDYKDRIAAAVEEQTGRTLKIAGDIELSVFPWLGVNLGAVELGNAAGFSGEYLARTERVKVRVKLLPLLKRELQMDTVSIDGLALNLARSADGKGNWDGLVKPAAEAPATDGTTPQLAVLAIGGLDVRGSRVDWRDAVAGQQVAISGLALETGPVALDAPVEFTIAFDVESQQPALSGHVEAGAKLSADLDRQVFRAGELAIKLALKGKDLPGGALNASAGGDVTFDQRAGTLDLKGFHAELPETVLDGNTVSLNVQLDLNGDIEQQRFQASRLSATGKVAGAQIPGGALPFEFESALSLDLREQRLVMQPYALRTDDLSANGNLTVEGLLGTPSVTGELTVPAFNARTVLARFGQKLPASADPKALSSVALTTKLRASPSAVTLEPLSVKVDTSTLSGRVSVPNLATTALRFDLALDAIDVDRYLPPGTPPAAASPGAGAAAAGALPVELLRGLDLDGRLRAGQLKAGGMELREVVLALKAKDGVIDLAPVEAGLLGGRYTGKIGLDARGEGLKISLDERLSGVDFGQLQRAVQGDAPGLDLRDTKGDIALRAQIHADPGLQKFKATLSGLQGDLKGKALPGGRLDFALASELAVDLARQTLTADALKLDALGVKASGKLAVAQLRDDPQLAGTIDVAPFDPTQLLKRLGQPRIETADPKVLKSLQLSTTFKASGKQATLEPLALTLDETRIDGTVSVQNFAKPGVRFTLAAGKLNLDRYLPPQSEKAAASPGAAAAGAGLLPLETLRALDADGTLTVAELRVSNLTLSKVTVTVKGKDGRIGVKPLNAQMYGGAYDGNIALDATGDQAKINVDEKLTGVQLGPLLSDLRGEKRLAGRGNVAVKLSMAGNTAEQFTRTLNGQAALLLADGAVKGIDIVNMLCGGLSSLGWTDAASGKETKFAEFSGSANITNGVLENRDLQAKSPLLRIAGGGRVDLVRAQIDYALTGALVASCQGQGGLAFTEIAGLDIPIRVTGPLSGPRFEPDFSALVQKGLQKKIQETLGKKLGLPAVVTGAEQPPSAPTQPQAPAQPAQPAPPKQPQKPEDVLKDVGKGLLKGIFGQ